MQGAVLTDDGATVDAHNLAVREGLANDSYCLCVEVGLGVCGYEYGTIDDQIVGVGGRQAVVAVVDGAGQGQLQEAIGPSVECAKLLQFLFHESEVWMVVVASCI